MREQQAGALGVHPDRLVVAVAGNLQRGEVDHVGEVVGQVAEVAGTEVAHAGGDAQVVDRARALPDRRSRAIPHTSFSRARNAVSGNAIWPAGPVTRIFSPDNIDGFPARRRQGATDEKSANPLGACRPTFVCSNSP